MLVDRLASVNDDLFEILHSPDDDTIVNIDQKANHNDLFGA